MEYDYEKLLTRALQNLPEAVKSVARFEPPEPEVFYEGKTTVIRNMADIADALRRNIDHVFAHMLRELGTSGNLEGRRAIFKGRVQLNQIRNRYEDYVNTYVLCGECKRPDTHLEKETRTLILKCDACGAHRPVMVKRVVRTEEAFSAGKTYDVIIQDISRRGDGVAKIAGYTVFVPQTKRGDSVKIMVDRISGRVAFARVVS